VCGSTGERLGAVIEPGVRDADVAEAWSDVAATDLRDVGQLPDREIAPPPVARRPSPAPLPQADSRKSRRVPGSAIFRALRRLWIPLVILVVVSAGGLTVARLHGIFGSEKLLSYGDTKVDNKPFNPKHFEYEIFGPPGTVADISYFDVNGDPAHADGVRLPWSLEFAVTPQTAAGDVAAQGDSDSIGCRIKVDGVVKTEKITHGPSAFASCLLKADE
jgi:hypothetical protein